MTPLLLAFLVAGAAALIVGALALISLLERRDILMRATDASGAAVPNILRPEKEAEGPFTAWITRVAGTRSDKPEIRTRLTQAGVESSTAAAVFWLLRTVSLVAFPSAAWLLFRDSDPLISSLIIAVALFIGFIFPLAMLDRMVRLRQDRIRHSVPDALDLLVVCVEAGISLDAAIVRVSRDLRLLHPDLAQELAVVNRVTNAGIPRDVALRGLHERTGVGDLRALVSSLVQSEKWGTSIATVLRVSSDTLRRKRRQAAEKRAKQAPIKMTFPLLFLILPPLFVVILGPAIVRLAQEFSKL